MKAGWHIKTIGDVCEVINGGTPKTGVSAYWGGPHQWVTPAEMGKRSSPYIEQTERTITDKGLQNSSARLLPSRSVILSSRAPIGHLVINTKPMATNQGCKGLIPGNGIDDKFLFYYLTSIVPLLNELGTGATFKELSGGKLKEVSIPVPPVPEQKRIVGILDQALDGIAKARTNAEQNLQNARALFESHLQSVFTQRGKGWVEKPLAELCDPSRVITYGVIKLGNEVPNGVPCLRTSNVRWLRIDTGGMKRVSPSLSSEYSRTILKGGEVLVNVRGTLGGVAVVPSEMAGWNVSREVAVVPVDSSRVNPIFLSYLIGSGMSQQWLGGVKKGAAYVGINIEDLRLLPVSAPILNEQMEAVRYLKGLQKEVQVLESLYQRKLAALDELKKSLLHQAFNGELAAHSSLSTVIPFPSKVAGIPPVDLHAGILAMAYRLHEQNGKQKYFGHVKAEKIAHMIEAHVGIDLGRTPVKDAAGPNDYQHLMRVEHRAEKAGFFSFQRVKNAGYRVTKYRRFDDLIERTRRGLGGCAQDVDSVIELMLPMDTQQAEIFCTVYAAWNNLLLDRQQPTDENIVHEARENWHPNKLGIPREKFFAAIGWMRRKGIIPAGKGKKVGAKAWKK